MKTAAIITEYNPFHNGHKYQIDAIKQKLDCDNIIVIMSGEFTQRGIPAVCSKSVRTDIALECGVNLVILLPVLFSTASAEIFAKGAVSILDKLNCVDYLVYGTENLNDNSYIKKAALILNKHKEDYNNIVKDAVAKGTSYPAACETAFKQLLNTDKFSELFLPNNILALEYEKALLNLNSSISSFSISRKGNGYSSTALDNNFVSAAAIRNVLTKNTNDGNNLVSDKSFDIAFNSKIYSLSDFMPDLAADILCSNISKRQAVSVDDFSSMLMFKLLEEQNQLYNYLDCSIDLANKINKNINNFKSISQFVSVLKSKDYTYNRLMRCLCHILLNITNDDLSKAFETNSLYARILGFDKNALPLLKKMKENSSIPIITNVKDGEKKLSKDALKLYSKDIFASNLYISQERIKGNIDLNNEYQYKIIKH